MNRFSNRRMETVVYVSLWGLIVGLYAIEGLQFRAARGLPLFTLRSLLAMMANLAPFVLLFLLNNHLLIPRLLMKKRTKAYVGFTALAVIVVWAWQFAEFHWFHRAIDPIGNHAMPPPGPKAEFIPLPLLIDLSYALLVVGGNVAVAMVFKLYDNMLMHENAERVHAQAQLASLKAQLNPHFYMNMLNSIHGLIELDPAAAQQMLIGMSKLMHYMVYDSAHELSPLQAEVEFMRNYLELMSKRYPADKVEILTQFPSDSACAGVEVPPLLFLVFIENAFKHGVSYRQKSVIDIRLKIAGGQLIFTCSNPHTSSGAISRAGIGLNNISQRLKLLYGPDVKPVTVHCDGQYKITLTLPLIHDLTHLNH